jgi:hypothetical protein
LKAASAKHSQPPLRPIGVLRFSIIKVNCEGCGKLQDPAGWSGHCPGCGHSSFRVEIERAASGWEGSNVVDFIPGSYGDLLEDASSDLHWSTQSFLECRGVAGDEIAAFRPAPIELRRRMYVDWKRRELTATRRPDRGICGRCRVIFTIYENEWNRSGFCSRTCLSSASKTRER